MIDQQITTDLTIRPHEDSLFGSKSKYKDVSRHKRDAYRWRDGGFSPDRLPTFRGTKPSDAANFFRDLNLYQNESTFHAPGPFPSSQKLADRPDIERAINLYVQTAYGLKDGRRWKREYEGPLKSLLWKYFAHDSRAQSLWRDLDSLHDMTDRSDRQVSDQISPGKIIGKIPDLLKGGPTGAPGNIADVLRGNIQRDAPGIGVAQPQPQQPPQIPPVQPSPISQPTPITPTQPGFQLGQTISPNTIIIIALAAVLLFIFVPMLRRK